MDAPTPALTPLVHTRTYRRRYARAHTHTFHKHAYMQRLFSRLTLLFNCNNKTITALRLTSCCQWHRIRNSQMHVVVTQANDPISGKYFTVTHEQSGLVSRKLLQSRVVQYVQVVCGPRISGLLQFRPMLFCKILRRSVGRFRLRLAGIQSG